MIERTALLLTLQVRVEDTGHASDARPPSHRLVSRRIAGVLLALAMVVLIEGCATGSPHGHPSNGFTPHSSTW
ncbi:hypothetical protein BON30_03365 [Cystobacter ferrugineus]|uniref:Uncharacterized protein n=1 Tax=Cystobacter ferrugineus TaxID=83449 RepID=A0A1L9BJ16_9BACT|nr:hypothetical protein BON30_03365 [Cystobacter ferrugineus]